MAKFPHKNTDFVLKSLVLYKEQLLTHPEVAEGFCACILLTAKPLKTKFGSENSTHSVEKEA